MRAFCWSWKSMGSHSRIILSSLKKIIWLASCSRCFGNTRNVQRFAFGGARVGRLGALDLSLLQANWVNFCTKRLETLNAALINSWVEMGWLPGSRSPETESPAAGKIREEIRRVTLQRAQVMRRQGLEAGRPSPVTMSARGRRRKPIFRSSAE